jgi:hypothetical protein
MKDSSGEFCVFSPTLTRAKKREERPMEAAVRRIHLLRSLEDRPPRASSDGVLVAVPGRWVLSAIALIRASREFRKSSLFVTNVGPGSQAARAGIVRGDVMLRYDGRDLDDALALRRLTKIHTQGSAARKPIRIEVARGRQNLTFEVRGGRLGITVSPLLHRLASPASRWKRGRFEAASEPGSKEPPAVVHTVEHARGHSPAHPALALMPGDLGRPLLFVLRVLERGGSRMRRKRAKSLLLAARFLGA